RAGPRQHGRGAELVAALPGAGEDTAVGEEARLVDEFLTVGPAGHLSRRHLRILSVHRAIWRSYDSPRACEPRRPCDAIMTAHQRTSRRTGGQWAAPDSWASAAGSSSSCSSCSW